jgi:4-hydroxybenzoate polyprenyltransferase
VSEPTSQSAPPKGGANPPAARPAPDGATSRPKLRMQELNPYFGAGCLLAAIGAYLTAAYFAAAALAIIGVAFLLYWRDLRPWEEVPRWKRITVTTLIFIGGACLILYVISTGGF